MSKQKRLPRDHVPGMLESCAGELECAAQALRDYPRGYSAPAYQDWLRGIRADLKRCILPRAPK